MDFGIHRGVPGRVLHRHWRTTQFSGSQVIHKSSTVQVPLTPGVVQRSTAFVFVIPKERRVKNPHLQKTQAWRLTAELFITCKTRTQPKRTSSGARTPVVPCNLLPRATADSCTAIHKNRVLTQAPTRINLKKITLSEWKSNTKDYALWFDVYEITEKAKPQWQSRLVVVEAGTGVGMGEASAKGHRALYQVRESFSNSVVVVAIGLLPKLTKPHI